MTSDSFADLLNRISSAQSYEQAEKAAKALSTVNDPVAVPYLKHATDMWHLAPITIGGLRRIGDRRAVDALVSLLDFADPDAKALARSALATLEKKTADLGLKEAIRRALQPAGVTRPE